MSRKRVRSQSVTPGRKKKKRRKVKKASMDAKGGEAGGDSELALVKAARAGDLAEVKRLLASGVTADQASLGCSALHYATFYRYAEIVECLVENGAAVNTKNLSGVTPVAWAVEKGFEEIVRYLLEWRADPDIADSLGLTCMHKAAKAGNVAMCKLVLSNGKCEVNRQAQDWSTPLHLAVESGSVEAVELLLDADAQVNVQTNRGFTPLHRAVRLRNVALAQVLLDHGADLDIKDDSGRTVTHTAAMYNAGAPLVQLLLRRGPDLTLVSGDGQTALEVAREFKAGAEVITLLQEYKRKPRRK